ncbi:MAG: septum formation initiator family protein [Candidatus Omnitrophota bacterium]|nr:septum formation initiator family protein [Candidatus Omnitrophota bacterium]
MLRKAGWLFFFTFLVLLAFLPSYTKLQDLKQRNQDFAERTVKLQQEMEDLNKRLFRLENDPAYLEKVGREKMGVVRKGEVIYKLSPEVKK